MGWKEEGRAEAINTHRETINKSRVTGVTVTSLGPVAGNPGGAVEGSARTGQQGPYLRSAGSPR